MQRPKIETKEVEGKARRMEEKMNYVLIINLTSITLVILNTLKQLCSCYSS